MEGLIPIIYRAISQYANRGQDHLQASWFDESPSAYYIQLPGDPSRFRSSDAQSFSSSALPLPASTSTKSPLRRTTSRRLA
ncbi:hypothetical protein C4D60_Mb02t17060 [Musa balbisiana]|uniref:Uncharacterized protein n=1 Tax=Musa balbisiana TaxID=52838 RepID=A0A4S8IBA0_MUSBA|nr:hypothetical protein C4D60_Mb02t17060 [Musa balbisiana]